MKVSEESNQKIREVRHDIRRYFSNYLQLLEEGKVELVKKEMHSIFMDTMMPKMDGLSVHWKLENKKHTNYTSISKNSIYR